MTDDQRAQLDKSAGRIAASRALLAGTPAPPDQGRIDLAASGAYYAMFYVAQAFLLGAGERRKEHAKVIGAFGEHFAKAGMSTRPYHRYLIDARALRSVADYGATSSVELARVEKCLGEAESFLALARSDL